MVRLIAVLCALLIFLGLCSVASAAPAGLSVSATFDRPSYTPGRSFTLALAVRSKAVVEGAKVSLLILSKPRGGKTLMQKTWDGLRLRRGVTTLRVKAGLRKMGARDGVYPATIQVAAAGVTRRLVKQLAVVDTARHGRMLVGIVWNVTNIPTTSRKEVYLSRQTAGLVRGGPNPGYLAMHVGKLIRYPGVNASFNIVPKSLSELVGIAEGYRLAEDGKTVQVRSDSPEAGAVEAFLDRMTDLTRSGRVEAVPSPYAYPALGELAARRWEQDIWLQITWGQDAVERSLGAASTPGVFAPELRLPLPAARLMRKAGGEHTVVAPFGRLDPYRSYGVAVGRNATMEVALADREAERIVMGRPAKSVPGELILHLARVRLGRGRRPSASVIVLPSRGMWRPSGGLVDAIYRTLGRTPWVRTVTLGEAIKATYRETSRARLPNVPVRRDLKAYYRVVAQARRDLDVYKRMARPDNVEARRLESNLLISESLLWAQGGPGLLARGLAFAGDVTRTVTVRLSQVSMPASQTITLPAQSGKIPIGAMNGTRYRLRAQLRLGGEQVDFPEGRSLDIELKPGDNYLTVPVTVRTGGTGRVHVRLVGGGVTLARSVVYVRTTYFNRMVFLAVVIIVLVGLLMVVYRKAGAGTRR